MFTIIISLAYLSVRTCWIPCPLHYIPELLHTFITSFPQLLIAKTGNCYFTLHVSNKLFSFLCGSKQFAVPVNTYKNFSISCLRGGQKTCALKKTIYKRKQNDIQFFKNFLWKKNTSDIKTLAKNKTKSLIKTKFTLLNNLSLLRIPKMYECIITIKRLQIFWVNGWLPSTCLIGQNGCKLVIDTVNSLY